MDYFIEKREWSCYSLCVPTFCSLCAYVIVSISMSVYVSVCVYEGIERKLFLDFVQ